MVTLATAWNFLSLAQEVSPAGFCSKARRKESQSYLEGLMKFISKVQGCVPNHQGWKQRGKDGERPPTTIPQEASAPWFQADPLPRLSRATQAAPWKRARTVFSNSCPVSHWYWFNTVVNTGGSQKNKWGRGGYPREGWALPNFLSQNSSSEEAGETRRLLCTSDEVFGIALGEDKDPHPLSAGSFSLL